MNQLVTMNALLFSLLAVSCGTVNVMSLDGGDVDAEGGNVDAGGGNVDATNGSNAAPVIASVMTDSSNPGVPINATCNASDADGDSLTYSWSVDIGSVIENGAQATWQAGAEGPGTISCTVNDGTAGDVVGSTTIALQVTEGLIGWYRFNGDAADSSGANNPGTFNNGNFETDRHGNTNGALSFNGSTFVILDNEGAFDLSTFTLAAWISVDPSNSNRPIFSKPRANGFGNFTMRIFDDSNVNVGGRLLYVHDTSAGNFSGASSFAAVPTGQFIHVATTLSTAAASSYLNGVQQRVTANAGTPTLTDMPVTIGRRDDSFFRGAMDEARIYNRALTAEEVAAIAAGSL